MKRLAAILLMGILFFNWYGYQLLSSYLEGRADRQLEASLDNNNYDESQLIDVKVPSAHLTYYNSSEQFERVDGQIEIGGVQYKFVKRRLYNDSVEMLCIPNHTAMHLQAARNDFFKQVNDLQQHNNGKKAGPHSDNSKSPAGSDYYAANNDFAIGNGSQPGNSPTASRYIAALSSATSSPAEQPPDQPAHC
ncbi:MAG: hypothetical protein Q8927_08820 [Bacteroidota bacterium]|nr:hypothetical protein [Bacteroidota bacterium]MDP4216292.1 hypothetical protein [Bacteroidota bacterium]MDP4244457.1 hypothetical protein [Bacteroidota bacterium]MDP4255209.1 hypothetical protein [Bacteroidota bacterium]MDP4258186.1 hypothetical protein [Bacteroidota bacterium]